MKTVKVVIGANLGDEGKGHVTDYFCSKSSSDKSVVIRYNSGAQAGHTVTMPNGVRHVFSHFGSGTLRGVPTYLSRFFIANPMIFLREHKELLECVTHSGKIKIMASGNCLVTTPYDMLINQTVETMRESERHGSCGVGFYETIKRSEHPEYTITMDDLWQEGLKEKLQEIADSYVPMRLLELGITMDERIIAITQSKELVEDTMDAITYMKERLTRKEMKEVAEEYEELVFEGAQGLMLDQQYQYFPHVTPSNTGGLNVVELVKEFGETDLMIEAVYVSRCYLTRHGAGPLPGELAEKPYAGIVDLTNQPNEYQGTLRFAYLDLDLLADNIVRDWSRSFEKLEGTVKRSLAVTCLDQLGESLTVIEGGKRVTLSKQELASKIKAKLSINECYLFAGDEVKRENLSYSL